MDIAVLDYETGSVVIYTNAVESEDEIDGFVEDMGHDPEEVSCMGMDEVKLVINPEDEE